MGESSRPRTRLSRDRRVDSTLPPPREEAPLRRTSPRIPGAARVPRSSGRLSAPDESPPPPHEELVAENARLKRERAEDADEIAQMLVRLAEAERALLDAEAARTRPSARQPPARSASRRRSMPWPRRGSCSTSCS